MFVLSEIQTLAVIVEQLKPLKDSQVNYFLLKSMQDLNRMTTWESEVK